MIPDPNAGHDDRILIDRKIDDFLKDHFDQYNEYFIYPEDHPELSDYIYYSHMKEEPPADDLTILALKLDPEKPLKPEEIDEMPLAKENRYRKTRKKIEAENSNYQYGYKGKPIEVEFLDDEEDAEDLEKFEYSVCEEINDLLTDPEEEK